jgi:hypothetical protein
MVAGQKHGTNIIGQSQQHKGQEGRDNNTSHKAVRTVSKSVYDWVFEWRDWGKTVQFECLLQLVPLAAANWKKERPRDVYAWGTFNRMWLAEQVLYVEDEGCNRYLR